MQWSQTGVLAPLALGCAGALAACSLIYSGEDISRQRPSDGGGVDAGTDAPSGGSPSLCDSSFVFCDGFEQGLSAWTPKPNNGGAVTTDASQHYRGGAALHSQMPAVTQEGVEILANVQLAQALPEHAYIRFFAFLPSPASASQLELLSFNHSAAGGATLFVAGSPPVLGITTFSVPNPVTLHAAKAVPLEQWVCFETEIDTVGQVLHVSMNGVRVDDLTVSFAVSGVDVVALGPRYYSASIGPAYESWFDEIAVDAKPVGCER